MGAGSAIGSGNFVGGPFACWACPFSIDNAQIATAPASTRTADLKSRMFVIRATPDQRASIRVRLSGERSDLDTMVRHPSTVKRSEPVGPARATRRQPGSPRRVAARGFRARERGGAARLMEYGCGQRRPTTHDGSGLPLQILVPSSQSRTHAGDAVERRLRVADGTGQSTLMGLAVSDALPPHVRLQLRRPLMCPRWDQGSLREVEGAGITFWQEFRNHPVAFLDERRSAQPSDAQIRDLHQPLTGQDPG